MAQRKAESARQRTSIVALSMATLLLIACNREPAQSIKPVRVISLHDTTTEIVVEVGAAANLIAITDPGSVSARHMPKVETVTRLPSGQLTAEALLALEPDLVLGTDVVIEQQPALDKALKGAGVDTLWIDPAGLSGLWSSIETVALKVGKVSQGQHFVSTLKAQLPEVSHREEPIRVFFYDCCSPPFTAGQNAPITELLERMGGKNIFDDVEKDWAAVSWESVASRQPEVIVVHDYTWKEQVDANTKIQKLKKHPLLKDAPAIKNDAIIVISLGLLLEGPRTLEVPELLKPTLDQAARSRP